MIYKHVISALSKYDLEYLRHYTGLEVLPLYSYCLYVKNDTYTPTRDEIPIFACRVGYNNWDDCFVTDIERFKIVENEKLSLQNIPIENCDIQYTTPIIGSLFTNN